MKHHLPKVFLSVLGIATLVFATHFSPKEIPPTIQKSQKVEPPPKKKKTMEEKARTVGERLQFEFDLQKNPKTGRIPEGIKEIELKAAKKAPVFGGTNSTNTNGSIQKNSSSLSIDVRGPGNLGGRTRAIGIDVRDANIMLAGGVSSGMFRSTDGGTSWTKVSANDEIHNVTCIAQDPRTGWEDTWYYGTGEGSGNSTSLGDSYRGNGIWKSTDNGLTWSALSATQSGSLESFDNNFDYVARIVVDPTDGYVYAAAGNDIFRSTNGGTSWGIVLGNAFNFSTTQCDIVVTSTGRLYAGMHGFIGTYEGVWTTTDGASGTWTQLAGNGVGTTPGTWNTLFNYGRVVLAIAPSDEDMLYVLYDNRTTSNCAGTAAPEAELFRWNQGTSTWTDLSANLPDEGGCSNGNDPFAIQGGYDLVVAVKPDNANTVFVGGTNIYRSTDGFTSTANTTRIGGYASTANYAKYSVGGVVHHPDIHTIVFASDDDDVLYCGSDGGIHSADITDASVEWTNLNNDYITYQYYHVDINPTNGSNLMIGGTQDNGTTANDVGTTGTEIWSGDGVSVGLFSGTDAGNLHGLMGFQNGPIYRVLRSGGSLSNWWFIRPTTALSSIFVTYFYLDQDNTDLLYYAAGGDLYRTGIASTITDGTVATSATGWELLTGVGTATNNNIRSMAASRNDAYSGAAYSASNASRKLYIGTEDGDVFRLDDPAYTGAATAPVDITPAGASSSSIVSGISVNPEDDNEVLVVYSNYGITNIFHTTDANAATPTWTAVEGSTTAVQLASIRSCAIINDPSGDLYFIGTSTGVYCTSTINGASTVWGKVGTDEIGYAVASGMRVRTSDNNMVIGTHGNGMYQLSIANCANPTVAITGNDPFCEGDNVVLDAGTYPDAPNSYAWTGGTTNQTVSITASGTYTVTVTVDGGCSGTATVATTQNSAPMPSITGDLTLCSGQTNVLDAGTFASYLWSSGGETTQTIGVTAADTYYVTVTNGDNCTATISAEVVETTVGCPAPNCSELFFSEYVEGSGDNKCVEIYNPTPSSIDLSTYQISFYFNGNSSAGTNIALSGSVASGDVYVVCDDGSDAAFLAETDLTSTSSFFSGDDAIELSNNGTTIDVIGQIGVDPGTQWNSGGVGTKEQTLRRMASITTGDPDGSNAFDPSAEWVEFAQNTSDGIGSHTIDCSTCPAFPVSITGDLEYCENSNTTLDAGSFISYAWSSGEMTQTIAATAGDYIVTVTAGTSCTSTASVAVTENALPLPTITGDLEYCENGNTTLDAGSFISYAWSSGEMTQTIAATAGDYIVTVTGANECTNTTSVAVTENALPLPTITGDLEYCANSNTTLDAGSFISYAWSSGEMTQTITATAGDYIVTVTDGNGCTGTTSAAVTENALPLPTITGDLEYCANGNTTLDAGSFISYAWSSGEMTQTITATAGDYIVTVTDANECTNTTSVAVTENALPLPTITGDLEYCANSNTTLDAGSFISYAWSSGEMTQTITATAGDYIVTVTDGNGCTGTTSAAVTENALPLPTITGDLEYCANGNTTLDAGSFISYAWSSGEMTQTITATAGDYIVTVTGANQCTNTTSVAVTENALPLPTITGDLEYCANSNTTLDAGSFISYAWSSGDSMTQTITATAGDYIVTVTDGNGCTGTTSAAVTENALPLPTITGDLEYCENSNTILDAGSFISYAWSSGEMTQTITATAGDYIVTVTGANQCTNTTSVSVTENALPLPTITGDLEYCANSNTTLDAGSFISYAWSSGEMTQTITATAGDYIVTVTDGNGCTGTTSAAVTENALPLPTITGDLEYCENSNTILDAGSFISYAWSSGEMTQTITATAGDYIVTVTGANQCTNTTSVSVTENALPLPTITGDLEYCANSNTTLDAGSFISYAWSSGEMTQTIAATAGDYTVTVTDGNGCTGTTSAAVTENALPLPTITGDLEYCANSNTTLDAGSFDSYAWSSGEMTQTISATAGDYTVTVTDANNCTNTTSVSVTENALPLPTITGDLEYCASDVNTTLDAGSFDSYVWSSGEMTQTISATAGDYTVTVTDGNGCTGTTSAAVTENTNPMPTITGSLTYCTGSTTTLDAGSFSSYMWSSGEMTQTIAATEDDYTVTVTDGNGCTGTTSVAVTENTNLTPNITGDLEYCASDVNTTLDAGSFDSYAWSSGEMTQTISASAGDYTVTVTDGNGCTGTTSAAVTENANPMPSITGDLEYCASDMNTTLDAGSFDSYAWSSGEMTQTITATAGDYTVTVTDGNGCTGTTSAAVTENENPMPTITGDLEYCASDMNTTLDAGSFSSYMWSSGEMTQTIAASAGDYTVTVTDGNGCTGTTSASVTENANPMPTITGDLEYCASDMNTTLDAGSFDSYAWSSGEMTQTISASVGDYTVTVTDGNGCTGTTSAAVTENANPMPSITGDLTYCEGGNTTLDAGSFDSYAWSSGEMTQTITATAGDYTVTVTDGNGCTGTTSAAVTENANPMPSITGDLTYCEGGNTTLDAGSFSSYMWSSGEMTQTIAATAGDYTVTVTDGNGCMGTSSVAITENTSLSPAITGDLEYCASDMNTTLDAGSFDSYAWSSGEMTQTIDATAGDYTVTVTDGSGCTGTDSVAVTENANPMPSITGDLEYCENGSTTLDAGSFDSYAWSSGEMTQTIDATAGDYTVTVTDGNGCTGTTSAAVTENANPMPSITGDLTYCEGGNTTLDAGSFSSYMWSSGEMTQTIAATAGDYTVTVTDGNGCTGTTSAAVTENANPLPSIAGDLEYCASDMNTTLDAGSFDSYMWSSGEMTQTIAASGGDYTVTVTDGNGCTGTDSVAVTENANPMPSITGDLDYCASDVNTTLDAGSFSSYMWSSGEMTQTIAASAGDYTVTVTDGNGCTGTDSVAVTENADPLPTITGDLTYCTGGSTTLDAGSFSSYMWSSGEMTQTIAATAGDYTVTVTDGNGCMGTSSVAITENTSLSPAITGDLEYCASDMNTTLDAGSFDSYAWSSGEMTQTIDATAGDYTVTVTDGSGCTGTDSVAVTENANPMPSITGDLEYCENGSTTLDAGSFDSYAWSSGEMTQTIDATAGDYTVTVTDGNGCTGTTSAAVTENANPMPSITGDLTYCEGGNTTLDAGSFSSYMWSSGEMTQTIAATAGDYTVTVTDGNGCTGTTSAAVTENANPLPSIAGDLEYCASDMNTTLDAGSFDSYMWSSGEMTQTIAASGGDYTVTVTDGNGCTGTDSVAVTENANPMPSITGDLDYCASDVNTTLDAGSFSSYMWSSGEMTQTIAASAGDYTVTVTDGNGCTGTDSVAVTENADPLPTITGDLTYCTGGSTTLDAGSFSSYMWSSGEMTQTITATAGDYTVTVTDGNGCLGTTSVSVTANNNISVSIAGTFDACASGFAFLDAGTYSSADTYMWSSGEMTQTIEVNTADTYTVTVTNDVGCSGTATVEATIYALPMPTIMGTFVVCVSGGEATLDAGVFDTYAWSNNSTTQTIQTSVTGIYTVTVTDNNDCSGTATAEVEDICDAFLSGLNHNGDSLCEGESIVATVDNIQTLDGYDLLYILFEEDNLGVTTYVDDNDTGEFSAASGDYQICAYVELRDCAPNPSPFVDTVDDMATVGSIQDGCFAYECSSITVPEALTTLAGTGQSTENTSTGQNIFTAEVCGGATPYSIEFTSSGGYASVQEYPSSTAGCINYQITYVDAATWELVVIDSNGCSETEVTFSSDGIEGSPLPQITDYTVTPETCANDLDGAIEVEVEGGDNSCDDYSYTATGPNSYSDTGTFDSPEDDASTTFTLEDLASGTYNVTVTDCDGTTTVQDFYVGRNSNGGGGRRRGRGGCTGTLKTIWEEGSLVEDWKVYPNPFTQETLLEFILIEDAHVSANIYSVEGRLLANVFEGTVAANQLKQVPIQATGLPIGVYILQFTMDNGTVYYEKLYVKK